MDNQVKLIDAGKLLAWIEENKRHYFDSPEVLEAIEDMVESEAFDPDTPPLPDIKPEDREVFARINATYYAEHQLFLNQRRELAEVKGREQKLKDLLLEVKRDCRPSGWYEGPIYGQIADLLSALYPEEETV